MARLERQRTAIDELVESGTAGLRTLDRFRFPRDDVHLARGAPRPAALLDSFSHAAGVGPEVETEVVRAMMVSRLTNLCSGVSGVRPVDGRGLRRAAERRHHADRARVRIARVLG